MFARRVKQRVQKGGGAAHLRLDLERVERQHDRRAMLAYARAHCRDLALVIVTGGDDDMVIGVGEGDEIAFGVDHHLLDHAGALFEQAARSEEHTSELQSLMRISYAVFCLKKKNKEITK